MYLKEYLEEKILESEKLLDDDVGKMKCALKRKLSHFPYKGTTKFPGASALRILAIQTVKCILKTFSSFPYPTI